jgi:hypothetical protein
MRIGELLAEDERKKKVYLLVEQCQIERGDARLLQMKWWG